MSMDARVLPLPLQGGIPLNQSRKVNHTSAKQRFLLPS